jgi:hypothetical protein
MHLIVLLFPHLEKKAAIKSYINDDPMVAYTLKLHSDTFFSLAELAGFLPIINVKARKYNPMLKQCYWYARAVYESIKRKYEDCDKIRGKA